MSAFFWPKRGWGSGSHSKQGSEKASGLKPFRTFRPEALRVLIVGGGAEGEALAARLLALERFHSGDLFRSDLRFKPSVLTHNFTELCIQHSTFQHF